MSDQEQIRNNIIEELRWDPRVEVKDIEIKMENGTVILTGTVKSFNEKRAAEQDIRTLKNVTAVKNKLEVLHRSSVHPEFDSEIQQEILRNLRKDEDIEAKSIEIDVNSGYVTLKGTQKSYWTKVKAENLASDVTGVIDVFDRIEVQPPEERDDKMIAHDIVHALTRSAFINPENIVVDVKDGKVRFSGKVKDWKAYTTATRAAVFTEGVTGIDNKLVITDYF